MKVKMMDLILNYIILIILILVSVSFFTLFERKLLSYIQLRKGPNKVGIIGILQAFSDGIKLFTNEFFFLYQVNLLYYLSPFLMFLISFIMWIFYPYLYHLFSLNNIMMMIFCLLSLNVYPLMMAGIYSNSIYSMLGGLRSISQTISYEVSFILIFLCNLIMIESLNFLDLNEFKMNMFILNFPLVLMLYVSILAELNRTPFDFSEGESELISGFNIEYMSGGFALIFLAEYGNIIFLNLLFILINFYIVENLMFFIYLFWLMMLFVVIWIRAILPRLRYDKLMFLIWLYFLPIVMSYMIAIMYMKYYIFID